MSSWEYLIVSLGPFDPPKAEQGGSAAVEALNAEGDRGWEAVGLTTLHDGHHAVLMKRPKVTRSAGGRM